MYCNCWCTLCIFESHFPSFWECFLSRHGPKRLFRNTVSSRSSGRAPEPFSLSECTWRLTLCFCATFAVIRPLARSTLFRPVQQHGAGLQGFISCAGWENPAPELHPVSLSQGGNMAPQNKSAKDMHAQLSAWELLLGLPNTGSEQFTLCWAYYCLSYIVKQLEIGLE